MNVKTMDLRMEIHKKIIKENSCDKIEEIVNDAFLYFNISKE